MSTEKRLAVCAEAVTWLRTPWHHRARVRGAGVDCAQFPAAIYEATGMIEHIEPEYPQQWAQHRNEELFIAWIIKCGAHEIEREKAEFGDLGVWRWGRTFSHGAIFLEPSNGERRIIHAVRGSGVTIDEVDRQEDLRTRAARFFSLWEPSST